MKKPTSFAVVALLIATTTISLPAGQQRAGNDRVRDRFIGAWRLASLEEQGADGTVRKADCTGLLAYTRDGHMSVQVMYRNSPLRTSAPPVQYTQGGYEASFGTYQVDEPAHTFIFHVEGALVQSLIGKALPRVYEFSGNQLIVRSSNPNEHWKVTWEHY